MKKYIDIYETEKFKDIINYEAFLLDLEDIFSYIKKTLKNKNDNIIMFWMDALEYGDDTDMPFLRGLSKKGLSFEQAYTVTPYTHFTTKSILCKKKAVDDASYKDIDINVENSITIQYLHKKGYQFRYYGCLNQYNKELRANYVIGRCTPASTIFWNVLNDMLNEEKLFCLAHELIETHAPFLSADLDTDNYVSSVSLPGEEKSIRFVRAKQRIISRIYFDQQLEFYSDFFKNQYARIYMSDHGQTYGKILRDRFHTILKIVGENFKCKTYTEMFSYINFYELIQNIIERNANTKNLFSNYVEVQDVDFYDSETILGSLNKESFSTDLFIGYRGVITQKDEFFRFNDGREIYHCFYEDMHTDKERIEQLRLLTGYYKIDIEKDEKFKYSRLVYKVLENYKKRLYEETKLVDKLFNQMVSLIQDNKKIGIRFGGEETKQFLQALEPRLKKKISFIIDKNVDCVSKNLGIPIITVEEALSENIDIMILCSFRKRHEIKEELNYFENKFEVIDIYDYLNEYGGLLCEREFYNPKYIDSDFII